MFESKARSWVAHRDRSDRWGAQNMAGRSARLNGAKRSPAGSPPRQRGRWRRAPGVRSDSVRQQAAAPIRRTCVEGGRARRSENRRRTRGGGRETCRPDAPAQTRGSASQALRRPHRSSMQRNCRGKPRAFHRRPLPCRSKRQRVERPRRSHRSRPVWHRWSMRWMLALPTRHASAWLRSRASHHPQAKPAAAQSGATRTEPCECRRPSPNYRSGCPFARWCGHVNATSRGSACAPTPDM